MRRLSGGNMQKVILGRSLVNPVQLLITHNPSSGLDISSLEFIYRKLVALRDEGRSVLFLNEDLDEIMLICDRIAVMHAGRIVAVRERSATSKVEIGSLMATGK
jgi:simple sugar transport system ATP-binding protein